MSWGQSVLYKMYSMTLYEFMWSFLALEWGIECLVSFLLRSYNAVKSNLT